MTKSPPDLCCPKCRKFVGMARAISSTFVRYSWNCECGGRLTFSYKRYALVSFLNLLFCCLVLVACAVSGLLMRLGNLFIAAGFLFIMIMTALSSRYYKVMLKDQAEAKN